MSPQKQVIALHSLPVVFNLKPHYDRLTGILNHKPSHPCLSQVQGIGTSNGFHTIVMESEIGASVCATVLGTSRNVCDPHFHTLRVGAHWLLALYFQQVALLVGAPLSSMLRIVDVSIT
jgi:hypothetical protein